MAAEPGTLGEKSSLTLRGLAEAAVLGSKYLTHPGSVSPENDKGFFQQRVKYNVPGPKVVQQTRES